jgi:hypothetical protein
MVVCGVARDLYASATINVGSLLLEGLCPSILMAPTHVS